MLALLGAFPFPLPQGSQVYALAQARALVAAGEPVTLLSYGHGRGDAPDDIESEAIPSWVAPRRMRSGPHLAKPLADAALLARYVRFARTQRPRAVLAHNAEAALIALAGRPFVRVPVLYCVHTLLGVELSAYGPVALETVANRVGHALDDSLAQRVDGLIVLSEAARAALATHAKGPIEVLPPGLDPAPDPTAKEILATCTRHGLSEQSFFLYTGNLDAYQDLPLLVDAARRLGPGRPPVVIASHDLREASRRVPGIEVLKQIEVRDFDELRALSFGARALLLTRRRVGGFPIKLLNYMETRRPIVAFEQTATGLHDLETARLLPHDAGGEALASALCELDDDEVLSARVGLAARAHLLEAHSWDRLASRTLALVDRLAG